MKILFFDIICEVFFLLEVFKTCQRLVHPSWVCKFMLAVLEILISLCVCSSTFSHRFPSSLLGQRLQLPRAPV